MHARTDPSKSRINRGNTRREASYSIEQEPTRVPTYLGAARAVAGEGVLERAVVGAPGEVADMDAVLGRRAVLGVGVPPRRRHLASFC
jgi:hypothetical protein